MDRAQNEISTKSQKDRNKSKSKYLENLQAKIDIQSIKSLQEKSKSTDEEDDDDGDDSDVSLDDVDYLSNNLRRSNRIKVIEKKKQYTKELKIAKKLNKLSCVNTNKTEREIYVQDVERNGNSDDSAMNLNTSNLTYSLSPSNFGKSESSEIVQTSSIKKQWLSFLDKCGSTKSIPDNVNDVIKEAYKIMEINNWKPEIKELYETALQKEQDEILDAERRESAALEKGKLLGEISKIKALIEFGATTEQILSKIKFLNNDKVKDQLEDNLSYIKEHMEDSDSVICDALELVADLSDFA